MRFMIIRKADQQTEAWGKPSRALVDAMMAYNEAMIRAGVMLGGDGLKPSSRGHRIKFSGGKPKVTDGPFAESKELVAGYTIIQAKSEEEARDWISRYPNPAHRNGVGRIEVRRLFELEDFEQTPAIERMREQRAETGTAGS